MQWVARRSRSKNKAQLDKLQGQAASAAASAFHAECDRHYVSRAGTVTPCKMLSSKSGRSEVMFANGKASVCSAQLSWRQAPAAAKRSEQQAREQQAKKQAAVEASAAVHKQKQGSRNLTSCLPGVLVGKLELKGNPVSDLATGPTPGEAPRAGPRTAALGLGGCAGPRPQHRSIAARRSDPD